MIKFNNTRAVLTKVAKVRNNSQNLKKKKKPISGKNDNYVVCIAI